MPIVFNPPPGVNPIAPATLALIPSVPGVYIVGVKINVDDYNGNQASKFCPLYVGETKDLNKRIQAHQCLVGGYLNQRKELFDLTAPIVNVYDDIKLWNTQYRIYLRGAIWRNPLFARIGYGIGGTLIYFRWSGFFDDFFGVGVGPVSLYGGTGHNAALIDLHRISLAHPVLALPSNNLIDKINQTKNIISTEFYYSFYVAPIGTDLAYRQFIEAAVKCALEEINLYTYGHIPVFSAGFAFYTTRHYARGHPNQGCIKPIALRPIPLYDINFSLIQADLVNLTGGAFIHPLVIPV